MHKKPKKPCTDSNLGPWVLQSSILPLDHRGIDGNHKIYTLLIILGVNFDPDLELFGSCLLAWKFKHVEIIYVLYNHVKILILSNKNLPNLNFQNIELIKKNCLLCYQWILKVILIIYIANGVDITSMFLKNIHRILLVTLKTRLFYIRIWEKPEIFTKNSQFGVESVSSAAKATDTKSVNGGEYLENKSTHESILPRLSRSEQITVWNSEFR